MKNANFHCKKIIFVVKTINTRQCSRISLAHENRQHMGEKKKFVFMALANEFS